MTNKQVLTELNFLIHEVNGIDCSEDVKTRYKNALKSAIHELSKYEVRMEDDLK